jgi:hypothetical protein
MGRWGRIVGGVTAAALTVAMLAVSGPAQAASAEEARLHALTNQVRASVGLPALAFDEELAGLARSWAAKMAADGIISHNYNLSKQVTGNWSKVSENVGQGPDLDTVHRALVASKSHYINMTDTEVTLMGVGTVTAGNSIFIVEVFLGRFGAAPKTTTTKAPAPATTVAPKPTTTVAPKAPAPPKPAPTTTTVPVTVPVRVATAVPAIDVSPWGSLVIDVTRTLELATG